MSLQGPSTIRPVIPVNPGRQRGQGAVEFLVAIVPVLLLGLGSIEAIHWYFARQAVSLALVQAARAATTQNADPAVLDSAFSEALLPLHAAHSHSASRARLQRAMDRRVRDTGLPAWQIRILSPSTADFQDFGSHDPALPRFDGRAVIDNDYLDEQHQARLARGLPRGRGPITGRTILDANTLVLDLTWLHEPLLPGMRAVMRQLAPADARYGSLAMARGGYLPIRREVALVMQSHAAAWETPAHGRVRRAEPDTTTPSSPGEAGNTDNRGENEAEEETGRPGTPDYRDAEPGPEPDPEPPFDPAGPDACPGCCD